MRGIQIAPESEEKRMTKQADSIKVENGRLLVDVALTTGTPSKSGKSVVLFTTSGNLALADGHIVGINLYRKA